jgi:hypothetical protein
LGAQELRAAQALGVAGAFACVSVGDAGAFACVSVDDAAEELIG